MINQQQTITSVRPVRHFCLTCQRLFARMLAFTHGLQHSISRVMTLALIVLTFMLSMAFTNIAVADGKQRTRAQAVEIAKQRSRDGRVLSVKKSVNKNGVSVYDVKIISNGRVKVYAIREFTE